MPCRLFAHSLGSQGETELIPRQFVLPLQWETAVPTVIFHCVQSRKPTLHRIIPTTGWALKAFVVVSCLPEVRGPKAARIYAEAVQARQPASASTPSASAAQSSDSTKPFTLPNPYESAAKREGQQEVLVLRDGFGGWQNLHKVSCLFRQGDCFEERTGTKSSIETNRFVDDC